MEDTVGCAQLNWKASSSDIIELRSRGTVRMKHINFSLNAPTKTEYTDFCYGSILYVINFTYSIQSPTSDFAYDILNLWIIILL